MIGDGAATAGMAFEALNHAGWLRSRSARRLQRQRHVDRAERRRPLAQRPRARLLRVRSGSPTSGRSTATISTRCCPRSRAASRRERPGAAARADAQGPRLSRPPRPIRTAGTRRVPFDRARRVRARERRAAPPTWTAPSPTRSARLADRDPRVVAITAAMPDGTGLDRFARAPPGPHATTSASPSSTPSRSRPASRARACARSARSTRPSCSARFDQIVHDVALQELPVTFALDRAGLVGADGPTHHGVLRSRLPAR